jgi:hypothetical protein
VASAGSSGNIAARPMQCIGETHADLFFFCFPNLLPEGCAAARKFAHTKPGR